jgi:rod shape-determining protein MreC
MIKRPQLVALVLVMLVALILLNLPSHAASRLKLAVGTLFLPLFGLANSSHQVTERAGDALLPRSELLRQNEALRRESQTRRIESIESAENARENARLRQLLGWQQKGPWKLKLANVILRDPANWWRTVQINLGSRDNIRVNLPVLTPEGLVGRVASVSFNRSQIVLLGDPNCKVAALVENEARDTGILESAGPLEGSLLNLVYLSKDASLKPGQNVVTSGLGGLFPKGIPIGRIVDSRQIEYGLSTTARVKLGANLSALEEVWVLFP